MTRRAMLLWVSAAARLRADASDDIKLLVNSAAEALRNHDEKRFLADFDPAMKGYRELAANVHALLRDADVQTSIEILDGQMNWTLDISAHDLSAGSTKRQVKTTYRAAQQDGKLRFVTFEPVALFAAPHGREAWDAVSDVAVYLQLASRRADGREENDLPALMARFDRAMPAYDQLAANLKALTSIWLVEPALQLSDNDGDDDRRTLAIDWAMTLTNPNDGGASVRKEADVKCVVERRGKRWVIASLTPVEFFAPPGP